ncbi:hypothetical protein [Actinoallomurus sp. NPDC052274]|uniref:hypothetical protein n=1 Tax=Actinoallomurus sp. NPDC052274 TaxID=3155420 RepID=UPI00341858BC
MRQPDDAEGVERVVGRAGAPQGAGRIAMGLRPFEVVLQKVLRVRVRRPGGEVLGRVDEQPEVDAVPCRVAQGLGEAGIKLRDRLGGPLRPARFGVLLLDAVRPQTRGVLPPRRVQAPIVQRAYGHLLAMNGIPRDDGSGGDQMQHHPIGLGAEFPADGLGTAAILGKDPLGIGPIGKDPFEYGEEIRAQRRFDPRRRVHLALVSRYEMRPNAVRQSLHRGQPATDFVRWN